MICLPLHSTHLRQPLDVVGCFGEVPEVAAGVALVEGMLVGRRGGSGGSGAGCLQNELDGMEVEAVADSENSGSIHLTLVGGQDMWIFAYVDRYIGP